MGCQAFHRCLGRVETNERSDRLETAIYPRSRSRLLQPRVDACRGSPDDRGLCSFRRAAIKVRENDIAAAHAVEDQILPTEAVEARLTDCNVDAAELRERVVTGADHRAGSDSRLADDQVR